MTKIPQLNALYVFTIVAQSGSFSQAASELHLTHGAVSRQVDKLENEIGLKLFVRSSKGVMLTSDGQVLLSTATEVFNSLSHTISRLKTSQQKQPLVISCERSLAMKWLIPRLSEFQDQYPDLVVHISTGGGSLNFAAEYLDVAIRRADFPLNPTWKIENLMAEYIGPVCHPNLLSAYRSRQFTSLYTTTRPGTWDDWKTRTNIKLVETQQQFFDHFFLLVQAAISGLGVAVVPYAMALDAITSGQLIAPDGFVADGSRYCTICKSESVSDTRKDAFITWLRDKSRELEEMVPLR